MVVFFCLYASLTAALALLGCRCGLRAVACASRCALGGFAARPRPISRRMPPPRWLRGVYLPRFACTIRVANGKDFAITVCYADDKKPKNRRIKPKNRTTVFQYIFVSLWWMRIGSNAGERLLNVVQSFKHVKGDIPDVAFFLS